MTPEIIDRQAVRSFRFDRPEAWSAESVLVFAAPSGARGQLAMSREPRRAGETPADHVKRRVAAAAGRRGWHVVGVDAFFLGGRPAWRVRISARGTPSSIVYLPSPDGVSMVVVRSGADEASVARALTTVQFNVQDHLTQHRASRGAPPEGYAFPEIPIPGKRR